MAMVVVLLFRAGAGTAMPPALRLLKWGALKVVLVLGLCGCVSEAFALRGCLPSSGDCVGLDSGIDVYYRQISFEDPPGHSSTQLV